MDRIKTAFEKSKANNKLALMPFLVAGFPNLNQSLKLLKTLAKKVDFLEIGFPFSDPLADGPIIQEADQIALRAGSRTKKVFNTIKNLRKTTEIPITVLVYSNLIYQYGIEKFYRDAKKVGIDGVLVPDLPIEEMKIFIKSARKNSIANICMVSTNTNFARLKNILKVAEGFIYLTSLVGVTGERKNIPKKTLTYLKKLKRQTKLPVAVGFGVSNSTQVRKLKSYGADGVIVGSALIKLISRSQKFNHQRLVRFLEGLI